MTTPNDYGLSMIRRRLHQGPCPLSLALESVSSALEFSLHPPEFSPVMSVVTD
jgi:hypothetical protein